MADPKSAPKPVQPLTPEPERIRTAFAVYRVRHGFILEELAIPISVAEKYSVKKLEPEMLAIGMKRLSTAIRLRAESGEFEE